MCLSACACAYVCLRACARVCVRVVPSSLLHIPRNPTSATVSSNHVGDKCEAVTSVLIVARARTQGCGGLHPSFTHTHTPHNPAGLLVHLQRQYNPTGLPVRSQRVPQPHWALCAFTGPVRDTPIIPLVSLCVRRDVPSTPLGSLCVHRPSQGYTHNPTGLPVRSQGCT